MRNAIVQFHIDPEKYKVDGTKISKLDKTKDYIFNYSSSSFKEYCKKYSCDYILVTEPKVDYIHPTWERLDFWLNKDYWFNRYDNICYVDTDVFALPNSKNIFEYCKNGVFSRIPYWKADMALTEDNLFFYLDKARVSSCLFQAGVILLNKIVIEKTMEQILRYKEKIFSDDSVLLNYAIVTSDIEIYNIPKEFNVKYTPELHIDKVDFLHAFGKYKTNYPDKFLNFLKNIYDM